eukprot:gnl/TRDRNA2_/TRDRNA2_78666_c0_seq1.p1 gnl/TRDRNA2_/TRDRNA2_78666_c0~~gnl/TRDRNA2_/TRDRNA2_78666_c0_seq1.p1  ORF type:complete len:250 (-),score=30.23 gnl/TRDRNA2_/TRDRNA2_78666_c0_seq1:265-1014(-)
MPPGFFLHKRAVAYALGKSTAGLQMIQQLRQGFKGSLVNQISADGEMPHETKRTMGATYSKFNLKAWYMAGIVVERCCAAWGCDASFTWDWSWESPRPKSSGTWVVTRGQVSGCDKITTIRSPDSADDCRKKCSKKKSNAFNLRWRTSEVIGECYCRLCPIWEAKGKLKNPPDDVYSYEAHVFEQPPAEGTGSVRKALDFVVPYATGKKRFSVGGTRSFDAKKTMDGSRTNLSPCCENLQSRDIRKGYR